MVRRSLEKKFKFLCLGMLSVTVCNVLLMLRWNASFELDLSDVEVDELGVFEDNMETGRHSTKTDVIHIIIMVDRKMKEGLPVVLASVLRNTNHTVIFHIGFCQEGDDIYLKQYLSCFRIPKLRERYLDFVKISQEKLMDSLFRDYLEITTGVHESLGSCSDLLRLKSHRIFPSLDKALWFDVDMLVLGDVAELWTTTMDSDKWIYVAKTFNYVESFKVAMKHSTETFKLYEKRYNKTFTVNQKSYNNGVAILNLKLWKDRAVYFEHEIAFWMKTAVGFTKDKRYKQDKSWWFLGNQPLMYLAFQDQYGYFPQNNWHVDGLGHGKMKRVTPQKVIDGKLLHWNGDKKPWRSANALYRNFWEAHVPKRKKCVHIDSNRKKPGLFSRLFGVS